MNGEREDADTPSDEELVARIVACKDPRVGEQDAHAAFQTLYDHHAARLMAFVAGRTDSRLDVDDLCQAIWLRIWDLLRRNKNPVEVHGSFRGWLFQVARNVIIDRLRARRKPDMPDAASLFEDVAIEESSSGRAEDVDALKQFIRKLSASDQAVVQGLLSGMTLEEFAVTVGRSLPQASRMREQAKRNLRTLIEAGERGIDARGETRNAAKHPEERPAASAPRIFISSRGGAPAGSPPIGLGGGDSSDPQPGGDDLDATAFAPAAVCPGGVFVLQVFAHQHGKADEALRLATEIDPSAVLRGRAALTERIQLGQLLRFDLVLQGATTAVERQSLVWRGVTEGVSFPVTLNSRSRVKAVSGSVTISVDKVPIGVIAIVVPVSKDLPTATGLLPSRASHLRSFFVSYASKDRPRVTDLMRMVALLGKSYRQDILDLDPGDRWRRKLYRFIEECDATLLFWSRHARESIEVRRECRHCIRVKGIERLIPVILEKPPPKPHPELAKLHMNDRRNYFVD